MAQIHTIDLRSEAEVLREWFERRISSALIDPFAVNPNKPVRAIVALYCYVQAGWIGLDFDRSDDFHYDGDISKAAWDDLLERPAWQAFVDAEGPDILRFIEADGSDTSQPAAEASDEFLSPHFGQLIADVLASTWEAGRFSALNPVPDCMILVDDFHGNWGWKAKAAGNRIIVSE